MRYLIVLLIIVGVTYYLYQTKYFSVSKAPQPQPKSNQGQPRLDRGQPSPIAETNRILGTQTKTSDCVVNGSLQDKACTPGSIFPNATKEQVCTPGYSKSVRNVPADLKKRVYKEYGITTHQPGEYEVDHLISLEIGGSNDLANLWPEAGESRPGFHEKDQVENYLHTQVCKGNMTLQQAQEAIANNWLDVYNSISDPAQYDFNTPRNRHE